MASAEQIEIALASDDGYFCGLFVTACSIAESATVQTRLVFNILDGGITPEHWALLERRVKELHAESAFRRLPVDEQLFAEYPAWHGNKMAYARLMLPTALPGVDWIVYCDVDFLWMRDIAELWAERDDSLAFIGVQDLHLPTRLSEKAWFEARGYPFDLDNYFCSGLCFMNLKAFREEGLVGRIKEVLDKHKDIQCPDQAALNIVTWGRRRLVDGRWQRFTERLTRADVLAGVVIHHAGDVPWKKRKGGRGIEFISDAKLLWHRANARFLGISTWRSLRKTFSPSEIFRKRLAVHLFRLPGVLLLARAVLWALKHPGVYTCIEMRVRRVC